MVWVLGGTLPLRLTVRYLLKFHKTAEYVVLLFRVRPRFEQKTGACSSDVRHKCLPQSDMPQFFVERWTDTKDNVFCGFGNFYAVIARQAVGAVFPQAPRPLCGKLFLLI